jgi:hypothetical protein
MPLPQNYLTIAPPQNYDLVRGEIQSGDILLCSGSAAFSQLIQAATGSTWSHVAFVLRVDAIDRVMVLESVESIGVRTVPLSNYVRNYNATGKGYPGKLVLARHADFAQLTNQQKLNQMSQFAVDCFGCPYNSQDIARIAARIAMHSIQPHPAPIQLSPNTFICSEYAARCYTEIGIDIAWNQLGFIAPSDFAADPKVSAQFQLQSEN